jgi:radical SAM protein with 4Fe4S-binding SPASM domain
MMPVQDGGGERDYYRELVRATAERHHLLTVHWELTYRCNCTCTHCYVVKPGDPGYQSPGPELSTEEAKRVLDQLADEHVLNVNFSGGEILCRSDFFEIARYARQKRFAVRVLTNGTLIGPDEADQIATLYPVRVDMSIYGPTAEAHDRITQVRGSFEKTLRACRLLRERNVRTSLKTPLMRENVRQYAAIREVAEKLGAEFRYDVTIVARDDGSTSPLRHRLSDDDLTWFYGQTLGDTWRPKVLEADDPLCLSARNQITIGPRGEVYPCIQVRLTAGNVREQSVSEIWRTSPVLNRLRRLTLADFRSCATCDVREYCSPCPGVALLEDGSLLGPSSVACREAHLLAQVFKEREEVIGNGETR